MQNKIAYSALILALIALALTALRPANNFGFQPTKKETAFERVMRTRTLRCGYSVWAPFFMIEPNTKAMSGTDYEIIEAIGKVANLKIDWQDEVGFGTFPEQLQSQKDDAFCVSVWISAARAQRVELTTPADYSPLYAYVRDGDTRFDNNLDAINNENVTITVIDGSAIKAVADGTFPKAKQFALPGDSDGSQMLMALAARKGDVTFDDEFTIHEYNDHNPDKKLRRVPSPNPVRIYGGAFSVGKGEWELRDELNAAIAELLGNGTIDRILSKYEVVPGSILHAAKPYAHPLNQ
jgi:ABC-type amino acid transport substrate-binding protein